VDTLILSIGNKNYSSWSLRPWLVLKHLGVPFEEAHVPLKRPDGRAMIRARHSPSGRVPALQHGSLVIWDSLAIVEYLADIFPHADLWPQTRDARAVARAVSAEMHAGFATLRRDMPMNIRKRHPGMGRTAQTLIEIDRIVELWRDCRARFGQSGPFLFGQFTIADAMYAPVVTRFETYAVKLEDDAAAYCQTVLALPAMREWARAALDEPDSLPTEDYPDIVR
jgi:glutathione S-transferase